MRLSPAQAWRTRRSHYWVRASKCKSCGKLAWPPRARCPYCGSKDVEEIELSGKGKLVEYSVAYHVPEGLEHQAPLIVGVVELEEGIRIPCVITDADPDDLSPGMTVEAVTRRTFRDGEAGIIRYALRFRPALEG